MAQRRREIEASLQPGQAASLEQVVAEINVNQVRALLGGGNPAAIERVMASVIEEWERAGAEASAVADTPAGGTDHPALPADLTQRLADLSLIRDDLERLTRACADAALARQGQQHRRELEGQRLAGESLAAELRGQLEARHVQYRELL
jgi:hypothetical protein